MIKVYLLIILSFPLLAFGQIYSHQDTLRGSNGRGRDWWDVQHYNLSISLDTLNKTITGTNEIIFKIIGEPRDSMQIDLQEGLSLNAHIGNNVEPTFYSREGNVYWITNTNREWKIGEIHKLSLKFYGKQRVAINPPWDGGFIWTKDPLGNPWIAVACQGLGSSSWFPCKDYQGDEPDSGTTFQLNTTFGQIDVANGRKIASVDTVEVLNPITGRVETAVTNANRWAVKNPINSYNTTFYLGNYAHFHDTLHGEQGILDLDFYPLKINEALALKQWAISKEMLRCFEYWMGPYPFYEDGYKLVEAPYLGMEHQSAIAYGNGYKNGYRGKDLSGTGIGMLFDFILVHESGHEWFGNSNTAKDIADNWLHEGFTTYAETLFTQWISTRDSSFKYAAGEWKRIANDFPVIGNYGVDDDRGSDKYYKGAAVVHMIRIILNDDEKFRSLLRGLNKDFYHKIVTSDQVETYISEFTGEKLKPFFDEYLRTTNKPILEWYLKKGRLHYRWLAKTKGFWAPFLMNYHGEIKLVLGDEPFSLKERKFQKNKLKIESCGWYEIRKHRFKE